MIDGETRLYGLYGYPVKHSLSPLIFNSTFEKKGLNRTYLAFSIKPENLKKAVEAARSLGVEGFNVTMPHKTHIVAMMNGLDRSSRETGSVNTVSKTPRGLVGHNTDGQGALRAIKAYGVNVKDCRALVLGAGGAARSIIRTLSREASQISVLSRDARKAKKIADSTKGRSTIAYGSLTGLEFERSVGNVQLLVNATPYQTPTLLRDLNIDTVQLPSGLWVFDLAYDHPPEPPPTGVSTISPLEMLVQQAALSYEIWLGSPAPFDLMRSTLVQHVGKDWK